MKVANQLTWLGKKIILDYSSAPNVIIRVLKSEKDDKRGRTRGKQSEEDSVWKMEE